MPLPEDSPEQVLDPIQAGKFCINCWPAPPNMYMLTAAAAETAHDSNDLPATVSAMAGPAEETHQFCCLLCEIEDEHTLWLHAPPRWQNCACR